MKSNITIDSLFSEKINQIHDLPAEVDWNSKIGWLEYQKQYHSDKAKIKKLQLYLSSAAAVFVMIFLLFIYNQNAANKTISINNLTTKIREVTLPDNNTVWLNKNSSVEYPTSMDKEQYEVSVKGEVFIEIHDLKSKRYVIKAHNAIVYAETQTSFNIKAFPDEENIDITVKSGALTVTDESYHQGLSLLVTQGNYCSVHKSRKLVYASENINDNYLAWKTGELVFDELPIATVSDILAKYYDIKIELEDVSVAYCLFSGTFKQKPIDLVLNQIQSDLNFTIIKTGDLITVSGKGCLEN